MPKLKAVIVGAGLISQKKHIPAFLRIRHKVDLVAICDVNLDAAEKARRNFGIPRAYGDLSEMLKKERPDLVDICTPPQTHVKLAIEATKQGCHLLIEKPMALNAADCQQIVSAAQSAGTKVCVGHSDLFYSPFMKARELVARGQIGEFRGMRIFLSTPTHYMTSVQNHWAHKLPGGVIGETGPHIVYMTLAFINPIREVDVHGLKVLDYPWSRFEDYRIELIGEKAISSVVLSYATNQWAAQVDIFGSTGILKLDLQDLSLIRYSRLKLDPATVGLGVLDNSFQMVSSAVRNGIRLGARKHQSTHDLYISRFVDSIAKGTPSPVPGEEGLEAVRVLNMVVAKLENRYEQVGVA